MHRIVRRLSGLQSERGFSLVEIMIGGLVLVVGLVMIAQFFASAAARVLDSDIRSVLHQVASQDLETIRGLQYDDVGTTTGHPQGTLAADEDRTVQNTAVHIHRDVIYWTDASYTGPYPANYRRVTVTVSAASHTRLAPVQLVSNVAGGTPGGTLDITVTDSEGQPVPDALITITNDHLIPHVHISSSALRTDSQGRMIVPGLTPDDTANYIVSVSKSGYNTDVTVPLVVQDGLPYTVVQLTIDRVSTLRVRVEDTNGMPLEGLNLTAVGPKGFNEAFASTAGGTTFAGIRFSTDLDPYIVRLLEGQGYDPKEESVILDPGTTREVLFTLPAGGPTTTTLPLGTLTLRVVRSSNGNAVSGALVQLNPGGFNKTTNSQGYVNFSDPMLPFGTYSIVVTRSNYYEYRGDVVVNGASTAEVRLVRR